MEKQKTLGYRIHEFLSYRSYPRKDIGYLYAIQHGAKIIYETDDDNSPTSGKIGFYQKETGDFYVYKTDSPMVNPYEHFGQSTIWPRGYPLDHIADPPSHKFVKCEGVDSSIQQGVVNGDPDVDAIFRLTRKRQRCWFECWVWCWSTSCCTSPKYVGSIQLPKHAILTQGIMGPVATKHGNFSSLWYLAWLLVSAVDVGHWNTIIVFSTKCFPVPKCTQLLVRFQRGKVIYYESGRLIEFLNNWKSEKPDFFSRVLDLSIAMAQNGFWGMTMPS